MLQRWLFTLTLVLGSSAALVACSDDESAPTLPQDAATPDADAKASDGGSTSDASADAEAAASSDAKAEDAAESSIVSDASDGSQPDGADVAHADAEAGAD